MNRIPNRRMPILAWSIVCQLWDIVALILH